MSRPAPRSGDTGTREYVNRKAFSQYEVLERLEAGIVLTGAEVKSLRAGGGDLQDAYAKVDRGELWLHAMKISPYQFDTLTEKEPSRRPRKLLVHKREILRLRQRMLEKGFTLVPLKAYFKEGKVKIELGIVRGKKLHERRQTIAERDAAREIDRARKERSRDEE